MAWKNQNEHWRIDIINNKIVFRVNDAFEK